MLAAVYHQLFVMSIIVGGLYILLKILSPLTVKSFTASWHYWSYILVFSFLITPYHKLLYFIDAKLLQAVNENLDLTYFAERTPLGSEAPAIMSDQIDMVQSSLSIYYLPYILIAGTIVFLTVYFVKSYRLHRYIFNMCLQADDRQIKQVLNECMKEVGIKKEIPVYLSSYITTPFLYGGIKPCIILPDIKFSENELKCIFLHELTHWKRGDIIMKSILLVINAIHWFNPLAYIARRDIDRFCEMSCDEKVVMSMNQFERRQYCELILSVLWNVADQNTKLYTAFSDKQKHLERRIDMILRKGNSYGNKWIDALSVLMILAIISSGVVTAAYAAGDRTAINDGEINILSDEISELLISSEGKVVYLEGYFEPFSDNTSVDEIQSDLVVEGSEQVNTDDNNIVFLDEYFESAPDEIGVRATFSINWSVNSNSNTYGTNQINLPQGYRIPIDISWSPQAGPIHVGLYDRNSRTYYFLASSSSSPIRGTLIVPHASLFSFAVGNSSNTNVNVTGTYSY